MSEKENTDNSTKTNINWYPGHMVKAKKKMKENLELIDIVYELVDARIPFSSKIKDIDDIIKNKKKILILTKYDLCDKIEIEKWILYYKNKGYEIIKMDLIKGNTNELINLTNSLMKDLDLKRESKGLKKRKYRAILIGIPNVGKSTLINKLVNRKAVKVGNKPGITKSLDWIRINESIELMDTPGILWPKFDNEEIAYNLASMSAIKEEILPIEQVSIHIIKKLDTYYKDILNSKYGIDKIDYDNFFDTINNIGIKRGCMIKGGIVSHEKVYELILNDIKNGSVKGITFDRCI